MAWCVREHDAIKPPHSRKSAAVNFFIVMVFSVELVFNCSETCYPLEEVISRRDKDSALETEKIIS